LIDVLVEQRESLTPGSPKANILKPLSSWDQIRSARSFDSYQALAESLTQSKVRLTVQAGAGSSISQTRWQGRSRRSSTPCRATKLLGRGDVLVIKNLL